MATVSSMILRSLVLIGQKQVGGTLTSAEQTAYLEDMNTMLASWSIDRLNCYQILSENFPLSTGTASYTIGSGGTFNTTRPTRIVGAFSRDASSVDTPLEIIDEAAYRSIVLKSTGNTYPEYLYYDAADAAGLATIYVYPKPSASLTLYISSWKQLQTFTTINDSVVLPPGYQRAIEFNFAIEEAGGFINVQPEVAKIARDSLSAIKSLNIPRLRMRLDAGVAGVGRSNILTGP